MSYEYGIYTDDGKIPVHVESVNNYEQAQRLARDLAKPEKTEIFVYSFKTLQVKYRVRGQHQHA